MEYEFFRNNLRNYKQYIVKKDDSLYKIAKEYNTTIDELKSLNKLVSNNIYPNQVLLIPDSMNTTSAGNTYLTKNGDTLEAIMALYNIDANDLHEFNDLQKLKLQGNQLLMVKKKSSSKIYKTKGNESIEDILALYNLSPLQLLKLNEKSLLKNGNEIIIEE